MPFRAFCEMNAKPGFNKSTLNPDDRSEPYYVLVHRQTNQILKLLQPRVTNRGFITVKHSQKFQLRHVFHSCIRKLRTVQPQVSQLAQPPDLLQSLVGHLGFTQVQLLE